MENCGGRSLVGTLDKLLGGDPSVGSNCVSLGKVPSSGEDGKHSLSPAHGEIYNTRAKETKPGSGNEHAALPRVKNLLGGTGFVL